MEGSSEFKWHVMDDQHLHIVAVVVAVEEDHAAEAGIEDAPVLDRVVDQEAETGIVGDHTAVVAAARVPIVRVLVENPVPAASLRIGRRIVVPNRGTEVIEPYASTTVNRCTRRECRIIVS